MTASKTSRVISQTYILSCRREGRGLVAEWRISLEDVRTGKRRGFTSIEALTDFLRQSLEERPEEKPGHPADK